MGFGEAISYGFQNITNFSGRSTRSSFWWWILFVWIIDVILSFIVNAVGLNSDSGGFSTVAGLIIYVVFALATVAAGVRRLHDTGKSGWLMLLYFLCCIGPIILIIFWVQPSQPGDNQYGPQPTA